MPPRAIAVLVLLAGHAPLSHAGEQYVDNSGFAAGGYDVVAYRDLEQFPVGEPQPEAVAGKAAITAEHNGATWAFASKANRDRFTANPGKYVPRFDGHCAYGVSKGGKVPGNPNLWRIVDGELYFNIAPPVVELFEQDLEGNIARAGENWRSLESAAASTQSWRSIPENGDTYSTDAPIPEQ